jgi:hypothetical protein
MERAWGLGAELDGGPAATGGERAHAAKADVAFSLLETLGRLPGASAELTAFTAGARELYAREARQAPSGAFFTTACTLAEAFLSRAPDAAREHIRTEIVPHQGAGFDPRLVALALRS